MLAKRIVGQKNLGKKKFWTKIFFGKIGFGAKKINSKTKFYLKYNFDRKKEYWSFILTLSQNENKNCISATIRTHRGIQCLPYAGFFFIYQAHL